MCTDTQCIESYDKTGARHHFHLHAPHRHSIFCILPPDVLDNISKNGSSEQRAAAQETLSTDQTIRLMRATSDAMLGGVKRGFSLATPGQKARTIFNAHNTQNLPGDVVRNEGGKPTGEPATDEAYDGLGATFDLYWKVFERNSIDDEGLHLNATVHFGVKYDNAFWNGERMVFGDGDGQLFNRFTISVDVIGHELTHGVTQDEAQLVYFLQPGALNESMSDVFGSLVKQYALKQTAKKADWLIGAGLLAKGVNGVALRSMKAPGTAYDDKVLGKDPQPAHMKNYVRTLKDNGGVHINSGIPNHAFYLLAINLSGHALEKAGRIWYDTLRDPSLRPTSGFTSFAKRTALNASRLYGEKSVEKKAVIDAWNQVGIKTV